MQKNTKPQLILGKEPTHDSQTCQMVCPVCNGKLIEIRAKLQCSACHTICETCCEGGRG